MDIAPIVEVRVTQRFRAPADRVFDAWIDPDVAGRWLFATAARPAAGVAIDARVGGAFRFVERSAGADVEISGEYVEIARPLRLVFTLSGWISSHNPARVTVEFAAQDGGCELNLTHDGALSGHAGRVEGRWEGMLYGLEMLLDR